MAQRPVLQVQHRLIIVGIGDLQHESIAAGRGQAEVLIALAWERKRRGGDAEGVARQRKRPLHGELGKRT